ncbi:MAG: hypothetical protein CL609_09235 [Anaerolineaceae bacterium]|nr:hypothetical protein [Anaerolineaceae bacterium]
MKNSKFLDQILIVSAYLFFIIPLILFFFGWLKLIVSVIFSILLIMGFILCLRNWEFLAYKLSYKRTQFLIFTIILVGIWLVFSGIGGLGFQNDDFSGRNAMLRDLISHTWPVHYDYSDQPILQEIFGDQGALIYYFSFWLPSALVGKFFGWKVANYFLFLWTGIGVLLTILLIARYVKKTNIGYLIIFIFWGGLDIIGFVLLNDLNLFGNTQPPFSTGLKAQLGLSLFNFLDNSQLEWWIPPFQYSAQTVQLFWVFNQAIPAWLMTALLLNIKNRKNIVFTYALILLFAPFPSIGLIPFVLYKLAFPINESTSPNLKRIFRETISFQNTIIPLILVVTSYLFFSATISSNPHNFIWELYGQLGKYLPQRIVLFLVLEFGIAILLVYQKNNKFLWLATFITLTIIPLYHYGNHNDFVMRVSIPALLIVYILLIKKISTINLFSPKNLRNLLFSFILILYLFFSSFSGIHEFLRSRDKLIEYQGFPPPTDLWVSYEVNTDGDGMKIKNLTNFIAGNPKNTVFFKTIGKNDF